MLFKTNFEKQAFVKSMMAELDKMAMMEPQEVINNIKPGNMDRAKKLAYMKGMLYDVFLRTR